MPVPNLNANLPWQALAGGGNVGGALGGQLGQQYQNNYMAALGMNAAIHSGVQSGYDALRSSVDDQYRGILEGYNTHYGDVLGRIAGTNESNITDINTQYNAAGGKSLQDAISRGFGNSTVQQNMQRGIELDRARAITGSNNQFAQLGAQYANQIGLSRLASQQQGTQFQAGLGQAQLAALERVNAPYPDIGMYAQLSQMEAARAAQDANRDRGGASSPILASPGTNRPPSPFGSRTLGGGPAGGGGGGPAGGMGGSFFGGGGGGGTFGGGTGGNFSSGFGGGFNYATGGYGATVGGVGYGTGGYYTAPSGTPGAFDYGRDAWDLGGWQDPNMNWWDYMQSPEGTPGAYDSGRDVWDIYGENGGWSYDEPAQDVPGAYDPGRDAWDIYGDPFSAGYSYSDPYSDPYSGYDDYTDYGYYDPGQDVVYTDPGYSSDWSTGGWEDQPYDDAAMWDWAFSDY